LTLRAQPISVALDSDKEPLMTSARVYAEPPMEALAAAVRRTRAVTLALAAPLSPEDQTIQSMPDASPTKWHLAHTTWFWETFILAPHTSGYEVFDPRFAFLFNSYYEALGQRHARAERGLVSRPGVAEILDYRGHVDEALAAFAERQPETFRLQGDLIALGIAHEEQHQELILTDIKHALAANPFATAAYPPPTRAAEAPVAAPALAWRAFAGGEVEIGAADDASFAFDNERPRHRAILTPFALASRPATNAEYHAFIEDGGYDNPVFWLSDGWSLRQGEGWAAPLYWRKAEAGWSELTLHGLAPLDPAAPVAHISFYEASAFAAWAGGRLPEEREWEHAALGLDPHAGNFLDPGRSAHPRADARADHRAGGAGERHEGLSQMFGDVWEWTRSSYAPYPRYRAPVGAVGEYNGKFMSGQYVLRGGSCATPRGHMRATYRNFFPPAARWQFSGVRLARDA
jgi:ergothioneine biosynthesis protein EgtB